LELDDQAAGDIEFLVHQHLVMAHLAFRRDTSDEQLIKNFAEEVGSVRRLRMLFVLTCADLAAVGPGVLNDWKIDVLANLYVRSARYLQAEGDPQSGDDLSNHRKKVLASLSASETVDPWFQKQADALPSSYLANRTAAEAAEALQRFRALAPSAADAWAKYQKETDTVEFIAAVDQGLGRGAFSSMAGTLSSGQMQILSADTDPLADGLLMLRYVVSDQVVSDQVVSGKAPSKGPSPKRLQQLCQAMIDSVDSDKPPQFRQIWGQQQAEASNQLSLLPNEVRIDNSGSELCTIIEVFTFDRAALLYSLARKLHDLRLVIRHAKISTNLDQVVDTFYVTDHNGNKITDPYLLTKIREQLLAWR